MRLYEMDSLTQAIENKLDKWAEEHEGDITDFPFSDLAEFLKDEKETKLLNIACWIKSLDAEHDAIYAEEQSLKKRRTALSNKSESLENLIKKYYPKGSDKLSNARAVLSYRKSESVVVDNESLLPDNCFKIERKPILTEIKKNIESLPSGAAHISENWNLNIK